MARNYRQLMLPGLEKYVLIEPKVWHECDWSHWTVGGSPRPTEDGAFENVQQQAYIHRRTGGLLDFDDAMWLVYFVDMELRFRWQNRASYLEDVGKQLGLPPSRVIADQRRLDAVIEARTNANLAILPPIPIRHIRRARALAKLADSRGIAWAA